MSVTFSAPVAAVPVYRVSCGDETIGEYVGSGNAYGEASAHSLVCPDALCQQYGADVEEIHGTGLSPLNVNNRNALDILAALGLLTSLESGNGILGQTVTSPDMSGELPADDMIMRIDVALSVGVADGELPEIVNGNVTDGGRESGYLADRLATLRTLAVACRESGEPIVWN